MTESVATGVIAIFSLLAGFLLNVFYEQYKDKTKNRKENLKIHFDEINGQIISKLYNMSSSLAIQHNELIFESSEEEIIALDLSGERIQKSKEPLLEHYKFEEDENFLSFEVHFPIRAQEWNQLKREAVTLKSYVDIVARGESGNTKVEYEKARQQINDNLFPLQKKFKDFAQRLNMDVETVGKYQIGAVFKYDKKCPICRKF